MHASPTNANSRQTSVLRLPIEEFSAKVRIGPPIDDEEDYSFPAWAGVVPLEMTAGAPITDPLNNDPLNKDPRLDPAREVPAYAKQYTRKR